MEINFIMNRQLLLLVVLLLLEVVRAYSQKWEEGIPSSGKVKYSVLIDTDLGGDPGRQIQRLFPIITSTSISLLRNARQPLTNGGFRFCGIGNRVGIAIRLRIECNENRTLTRAGKRQA